MCLYPRLIRNKKYTITEKNGGNIPAVSDIRVLQVPVGCGKCMECKKQKSREWQVRLLEDVRHNKNGKFVTLTFNNESIIKLNRKIKGLTGYDLDNEIAKLAVRKFLERWRKEHKKSVRHWLVTELGHEGTENIHLHGIIWTNESIEKIRKHWKYGYIYPRKETTQINYVSERTVNYITKYINKTDKDHEYYNPKVLTSAGIGKKYIERIDAKLNKYKKGKTNETYKTRTGHKIAMPVYWRNKIYSEEEREKLWLEKLDKQERWVLGEKVSIKNGEEEYYKMLEYARIKNKELGYGDNKINWDRKNYENERRKLKLEERISQPTKRGLPPPAGEKHLAVDNGRRSTQESATWGEEVQDNRDILYNQRDENKWI